MTALNDLLDDIFDGRDAALRPEFAGWLRHSRRFHSFATIYRGKIRAKLRNARDEDGLLDLRAELETAAILLCADSFTLEYEKYAAAKQRGPDFTVTFKGHTPFNVEVRRVRGDWGEMDEAARVAKLASVVADKVAQMPPSIVNLLWLTGGRDIAETDVQSATTNLRRSAERRNDETFTRHGYANAADFLKQYPRLSGILWRELDETKLWLNPLARHKPPPAIANALQRL